MKNSFATKLLNFVLLIIFIEIHVESASNRKCRLGTRIPHPYDCGKYMVKYKLNNCIHRISKMTGFFNCFFNVIF